MRLGIDFDNTIACYDGVFHRIAVERSQLPAEVGTDKGAVRDWFRAADREDEWTELQGFVYGKRMDEAVPFPGVFDVIRECLGRGVEVYIVSHKTRHPYRGPRFDLHASARAWLESHGVFRADGVGLHAERAFFELTKADKLARIGALGCTHFIDDLPEFLGEADFPAGVERVLFDPNHRHQPPVGVRSADSWAVISTLLQASGSGD